MSKFTQYRIFVAVVETGSLASAARQLNYTPPAISKQLVALEDSLKKQLFHRSHKKVQVTEDGEKFYLRCKTILADIQLAEEDFVSEEEVVGGELSITMSKAISRSTIFVLLSAFSRIHPKVNFKINFSDDIQNLYEDDIDFAFRLGTLTDNSHIVALPLANTQLVACATPEYISHYSNPKTISDLGAGRIILPPPSELSESMRRNLNKSKIYGNEVVIHTSTDIEAIFQAVRANMCIGFMLDVSIRRELQSGEFVTVLTHVSLPKKKLYLLFKKTKWKNKKHELFKGFVKQYFLENEM